METEIPDTSADAIEALSDAERDVFAEMIMRSLRGSWRNPYERAELLRYTARTGLDTYDEETIEGAVESYLSGRYKDGRYFRRHYGKVEIDSIDEHKARLLSTFIPNDLTWDSPRLDQEFSADE